MQNSNTHSQEGLDRSAYDLKHIDFHVYKGLEILDGFLELTAETART